MFKNDIHLRSELTETVDVFTSDEKPITKGELIIAPNKLPVLRFDDVYNIGNIGNIGSRAFKARSYEGQWYTLLECFVNEHGAIYPKVIIKSDSHSGEFKKIACVVLGLSTWLDNGKFADVEDGKITKHLNTEKFKTSISDSKLGEVIISSENWWQTASEKGGVFKVSQQGVVCVEARGAAFACFDVLKYVNRIKNVFSVLLGYPLAIECCFDISDRRNSSIYFANFQGDNLEFNARSECLVDANYLFSKNKWDAVFKGAFEEKRENFLNIWSRLPGLSDFSKFWEYELLACMALTDRYSLTYASANDKRLSNRKFSDLKKCLAEAVRRYAVENDLESPGHPVIESVVQQIQVLRNTIYPSFESCFEFAYNSMSSDLRDIVSLSQDDFNHLKSLRNKIAHGDVPKTKNDGDITHEVTLQSKLLVILYCWALRDLGIPESDFIQFLGNWMNPMIRSACLEKTVLDRLQGHYMFLPLNEQDFMRARRVKAGFIVLEYFSQGESYKYREDMELVMREWLIKPMTSEKPRSIEEYLTLHVDTRHIHSLCYVGSVYIECGEESHHSHCVCILNPPSKVIDKGRFWEYDANENKWRQSLTEN